MHSEIMENLCKWDNNSSANFWKVLDRLKKVSKITDNFFFFSSARVCCENDGGEENDWDDKIKSLLMLFLKAKYKIIIKIHCLLYN